MPTQRRRRAIAMSPDEIDAFLADQRTCRVGTVGAGGGPHVTPLWFAWDGAALWLYSIVDSQRWTDVHRDPRIAVVVDAGEDYRELRGVEMAGTATVVGEAPRTGLAHPELTVPERLFAEKYFSGAPFVDDGRHGWLRMTPSTISSWDFRKLRVRDR
ncbi:pyridoxamine 5'-phosphate oxidase family protein [Mycolicibacterium sp. 120266]|uniref:pyridoxamine 5'-phosphate oxidase family protein n=1 Tax=Mycolicibacterium sp. 120266 TaxID=3090601 RepID=UPI00299E53E0|nr:pyridoxamine 5'-phosphate oxidase family protein [Mycolicibacterium sp. 120266]MDX1875104.1 pyridoxamine 5'-phosphate oxidase family protein [Mycolicibacterium sp. 120266]